jgi:hypothetical protein
MPFTMHPFVVALVEPACFNFCYYDFRKGYFLMIELNSEEIEFVSGGKTDTVGAHRFADGVTGALALGVGGFLIVASSPVWVTAVGGAFVVGGLISVYRANRY